MKKTVTFVLSLIASITSFSQYTSDWKSRIGSTLHDDCRGIVEHGNFLYVAGRIEGNSSFEIQSSNYVSVTSNGGEDIFVAKLDKAGNYIWVKNMGGSANEHSVNLDVDINGNVYVTGYFESSFDFDPSANVTQLTPVGERDVFVAKFDENGDLIWVKQMGGTLTEQSEGISVVSDGVVISGRYKGTFDADPSTGVQNLTSAGSNDIFVVKLDVNGQYDWSKSYGSNGGDISWGLATDSNEDIFVTGVIKNTVEFEQGNVASSHTSLGNNDGFVLKISSSGQYVWSKIFGGTGNDNPSNIEIDNNDNIYVAGFYESAVDFDPGNGVTNETSLGGRDAFILKLNSNGVYSWHKSLGGALDDKGKGMAFDQDNNVYLTGVFSDEVYYENDTIISNGDADCYVLILDENGNKVEPVISYGSNMEDWVNGLVVDASKSLYLDGKFNSTMDVDPSQTTDNLTVFGDIDGYIFKLKKPGVLGLYSKNNLEINVYPNPVNNVVNIEGLNDEKIELYSINGQLLIEKGQYNSTIIKLDVTDYPSGVYFLKVGSQTKKIIKQ